MAPSARPCHDEQGTDWRGRGRSRRSRGNPGGAAAQCSARIRSPHSYAESGCGSSSAQIPGSIDSSKTAPAAGSTASTANARRPYPRQDLRCLLGRSLAPRPLRARRRCDDFPHRGELVSHVQQAHPQCPAGEQAPGVVAEPDPRSRLVVVEPEPPVALPELVLDADLEL